MNAATSVTLSAAISQEQFEAGLVKAIRFRCEATSGQVAEFDVPLKDGRVASATLSISDLSGITGPWKCTACAVSRDGIEGPYSSSSPEAFTLVDPTPLPLESFQIQ